MVIYRCYCCCCNVVVAVIIISSSSSSSVLLKSSSARAVAYCVTMQMITLAWGKAIYIEKGKSLPIISVVCDVRDAKGDSLFFSLSLSLCTRFRTRRESTRVCGGPKKKQKKKNKKKFTHTSNHKNVAPGSLFVSVRVRSEDDDENVFFYHLSDHVLFASE